MQVHRPALFQSHLTMLPLSDIIIRCSSELLDMKLVDEPCVQSSVEPVMLYTCHDYTIQQRPLIVLVAKTRFEKCLSPGDHTATARFSVSAVRQIFA